MNPSDIVLSSKARNLLKDFFLSPAHAVLLSGPLGTGKTHVARALAADLLATKESSLENHGYFRTIKPLKNSISIEQIRELIGFFRLKVPGTAAIKRVAILEDADTMGHEAQNALLKLLEEPPQDSVLILTSSQADHLLPTIRSRTRILQLGNPEPDQIKHFLVSKGQAPQAVSNALLRNGANIAAAVALLEQEETSDTTLDLVKKALGGTAYERMLLVEGLAKQREAAGAFADALATVATASLQSAASKGAATLNRWSTVLQAANTAQEAFERSGNPKLVLTELMLAL